MSAKTLYQFFNKVAESEELQYRLDEGGEIDAEALIALGAECGCEFTAEDLQDEVEYFFDTKSVEQVDLKDTYELKLTYIPKIEYVAERLANPYGYKRFQHKEIARLRGCRFVAFNIYCKEGAAFGRIEHIKYYDTRKQNNM